MAFYSPDGDIVNNVFLNDTELVDKAFGDKLYMWGYGVYGVFGNSINTSRSFPIIINNNTSAGDTTFPKDIGLSEFTLLAATDGKLYSTGRNNIGQLGNGTTSNTSSFAQVGGTFNNKWRTVSAGTVNGYGITIYNEIFSWGNNVRGQLGDGTAIAKSSPVQIGFDTTWKQVSAGYYVVGALKYDGTLWMWGDNLSGTLGTNDTVHRSSPVQTVAGGTNWSKICSNKEASHFAAIKNDGTLWLWGLNSSGQLGTSDITNRSSPVQTVTGGTNWKSVSLGANFTAAIKTDNTLWTWGNNVEGVLGAGNITSYSSPVQTISGGYNWKQVYSGYNSVYAIKTDGTLWGWGDNSQGQLGNNTSLNKYSSPIQIGAGGSNWIRVFPGPYCVAAISGGPIL